MPLSNVQIGVIAQNEFAKLLMIGSDGLLEVSSPMTDDERRDAEVHIHGQFGLGAAFQIKSVTHLRRYGHQVSPHLQIAFTVQAEKLISHPRFLYYIPYLSLATTTYVDPQFMVESTKLHKYATPRLRNGIWHFTFSANMSDDAHDIWVPDRVHGLEVAGRVLQYMRDLEKLPMAEGTLPDFSQIPGVVWVRRRVI